MHTPTSKWKIVTIVLAVCLVVACAAAGLVYFLSDRPSGDISFWRPTTDGTSEYIETVGEVPVFTGTDPDTGESVSVAESRSYMTVFYISCDQSEDGEATFVLRVKDAEVWDEALNSVSVTVSGTNIINADLIDGAEIKIPANGERQRAVVTFSARQSELPGDLILEAVPAESAE